MTGYVLQYLPKHSIELHFLLNRAFRRVSECEHYRDKLVISDLASPGLIARCRAHAPTIKLLSTSYVLQIPSARLPWQSRLCI